MSLRLVCSHAAIDCGSLADPTNGRVEVFNTTLGSPAVYTCNFGYVLVGNAGRLCTETGDWSGVEPRCDRKNNCLNFSLFHSYDVT